MKLQNIVAGVSLGLGAVAATNRTLRQDPDTLESPLGHELSTYRWRGFDVAYTEAGDATNPDLVLVHGVNAAGSSHEFRYVIDELVKEYHVIAPDLPGFGHSDRPPLLYSASLYETFVEDFLRDLSENPTVVASSLTGAYVARALEAPNPPTIRELMLICPTTSAMPTQRTSLRSLLRAPLVGEGMFNLLASRPSIRYFLSDHGFAQEENISEEWVEYDWATAHQPGARYAPASFISGFLNSELELGSALRDVDIPVTIFWGGQAHLPPVETGRELADEANTSLVVFEDAGLLPHAEFPTEFIETVVEQMTPADESELAA
jgi:pimeloyl-ACP methyl ester carboxylesterase